MDYITIIQGDDTNFLEDQFVVVNFNTNIDLSGFTATFTLGNVTLTYGNLSGKSFEIILSNEITSNLKIGKQYGELKLIDNRHRIRTVNSKIPFIVKKGVDETITFVNNSLNISMNVNDTVIDIYVETSGISKTEAQKILAACNDAQQSSQNNSNIAQNAVIEINQSLSEFNAKLPVVNNLVDNATTICTNGINDLTNTKNNAKSDVDNYCNTQVNLMQRRIDNMQLDLSETFAAIDDKQTDAIVRIDQVAFDKVNLVQNKVDSVASIVTDGVDNLEQARVSAIDSVENSALEQIELAKAQADRAETLANNIENIMENASDSDLSKLSDIGLDKINQTKGLLSGSVSNYSDVYNQILGMKRSAIASGVDVLQQNYEIPDNPYLILEDYPLSVSSTGMTVNLNYSGTYNYIKIPVTLTTTRQVNFNIHIEAIIKNGANNGSTYLGASSTNALMIQIQSNGSLSAYMYANDNSTKMLQTSKLTMNVGDRYIVDVGFDLVKGFYAKASCNGVTVETNENIGSAWIREAINTFWYGRCSWSNSCYVEVDLLHSYFDIDGNRTRALVQIPYYLSKTGSKITLSQYREFVEELYQKEGIGNYYTIDENNQTFTLPMGEIYGMISKRADLKLSNVTLGTDFITKILNELAPDTSAIVDISTTPTSYSSAFVAPCSGWYVCNADVNAKRYLYINGVKTGYCLSSSNQPSISVFLGLNDRVYWSGSLSVVNSQTFIPLKGCHYVKPSSSGGGSLDDLFG